MGDPGRTVVELYQQYIRQAAVELLMASFSFEN